MTAHHTRSRDQERRVAREVSGSVTPASGALWSHKGDVRTRDMLMELKTTSKASITLGKRVWEKIRKEALLDGKTPVLVLEIQDRQLAVLDWEDFLDLTRAVIEGNMGTGELP